MIFCCLNPPDANIRIPLYYVQQPGSYKAQKFLLKSLSFFARWQRAAEGFTYVVLLVPPVLPILLFFIFLFFRATFESMERRRRFEKLTAQLSTSSSLLSIDADDDEAEARGGQEEESTDSHSSVKARRGMKCNPLYKKKKNFLQAKPSGSAPRRYSSSASPQRAKTKYIGELDHARLAITTSLSPPHQGYVVAPLANSSVA